MSFKGRSGRDSWQVWGILDLSDSADSDRLVREWLENIHDLPVEFLNNFIKYAQEAAARAMRGYKKDRPEPVRLIVLVLAVLQTKETAWSFFRLEKMEASPGSNRILEFYLYQEGQ